MQQARAFKRSAVHRFKTFISLASAGCTPRPPGAAGGCLLGKSIPAERIEKFRFKQSQYLVMAMLAHYEFVPLQVFHLFGVYRSWYAEYPKEVRPPKAVPDTIWISIGIRVPMMHAVEICPDQSAVLERCCGQEK